MKALLHAGLSERVPTKAQRRFAVNWTLPAMALVMGLLGCGGDGTDGGANETDAGASQTSNDSDLTGQWTLYAGRNSSEIELGADGYYYVAGNHTERAGNWSSTGAIFYLHNEVFEFIGGLFVNNYTGVIQSATRIVGTVTHTDKFGTTASPFVMTRNGDYPLAGGWLLCAWYSGGEVLSGTGVSFSPGGTILGGGSWSLDGMDFYMSDMLQNEYFGQMQSPDLVSGTVEHAFGYQGCTFTLRRTADANGQMISDLDCDDCLLNGHTAE